MRRRGLVGLMGMAALTLPRPEHAQTSAGLPLVGVMMPGSDIGSVRQRVAEIPKGLQEVGLIEGTHYSLVVRFANGGPSRWPSLAQEVGALNPKVIIVVGYDATVVHGILPNMPLVFTTAIAADLIKAGVIKSYAQPGGMVTGNVVTNAVGETQMRIGLFKQIVPDLTRLGMIAPEGGALEKEALQQVAALLGFEFVRYDLRSIDDLEGAFASGLRDNVSAFYIAGAPLLFTNMSRVMPFVQASRKPTVGPYPEWGRAGLLMSYSRDEAEGFRRAGVYAAKILNGAKPGDLPIEQSSKFIVVINQKTAHALGIVIPPTALALADEVIE